MIFPHDFLKNQLAFPRVCEAQHLYHVPLRARLSESGIHYPPKMLYLRAFKEEQTVEVWASDNGFFHLIKTYPFTSSSGKPGPKQREGDGQIPEGFYHITHFNPESKYHLSFRINYPNQADAVRNSRETNPGSDIYFHGGQETIGCIPIGDQPIAELYLLCILTYAANPIIPVHIFPCRMEEYNLSVLSVSHPEHLDFWNSLKHAYQHFQIYKKPIETPNPDTAGDYPSDLK